jgi:nucleotide-binding universal stress UspA family protein
MTTHSGRPVVVGVDYVRDCRAALAFAVREAAVTGAQVRAVHVLEPSGMGAPAEQEAALAGMIARLRGGGRGPHVDVVPEARQGPVLQALVGVTREAGMLVVEHRRVSRLQRHRAPSTAISVAGRVHCPLVSVPEDWRPSCSAGGCVTVGIDAPDEESRALVERGFQLAQRAKARLRLLHAWSMSSRYDDAVIDTAVVEEWSRGYQGRLERMLSDLQATHPCVEVTVEVVHGDPAKVLLDRSRTSDLLLLGRGRSVRPLMDGLGSVSRAVLEDSHCPVEVAVG